MQAQRRQPPSPTGTLDKKPTTWAYLDKVVVGWVDTQEQPKSRGQYHCHEPCVRIQDLSSRLRSRGESDFWSQIKNCWTWRVVPQWSHSGHLLNFAWVGKGDLQLLAEQRKASQTSKRKNCWLKLRGNPFGPPLVWSHDDRWKGRPTRKMLLPAVLPRILQGGCMGNSATWKVLSAITSASAKDVGCSAEITHLWLLLWRKIFSKTQRLMVQ